MRRKLAITGLVAFAFFLAGEGALGAGHDRTTDATSISIVHESRANVYPDGYRMGNFEMTSSTLNPGSDLGVYVHPIVLWEWSAPAAPTSASLVDNFKWYMNDDHTTDMSNFASTWNNYPRSLIVYVNYTNSDGWSTETINTSLTLTGTGLWSETISCTIDVEFTSPNVGSIETPKAFRTLTGISWTDPLTAAAHGGYDEYTSNNMTLDIGYGKHLGLPFRMNSDTRLRELIDADGTGGCSADSAGTVVLGDDTWAVSSRDFRGMWKPATAMDGTADFALFYILTDLDYIYPNNPLRPGHQD